MGTIQIVTNLPAADLETARPFYTDFLGLRTEEFSLGWEAPEGAVVNISQHRD